MESKMIHGDIFSKHGLLILICHQCGFEITDTNSNLQLMKDIYKGLSGKLSIGKNKREVMEEIDYTMQVEGSSPVVPKTNLIFDLTYLTFSFDNIIDADEYISGDFYVEENKEGKYHGFTVDTDNGLEIAIVIKGTSFNTQGSILYSIGDNKFKMKG